MKKAWIAVAAGFGAPVLAVAAFWGGALYIGSGNSLPGVASGPGVFMAGGPGGAGGTGGPMAQLTAEERSQLQDMTADERRAFFEKKMGRSGRRPGGTIEGEILESSADAITVKLDDSGSRVVYVDTSTVVAAQAGAKSSTLAVGAKVLVVLTMPATDQASGSTDDGQVTKARAIIVLK